MLKNQGTDILSEVLEMGCQPAVLLFLHPSTVKSFLHCSVLLRLVLARVFCMFLRKINHCINRKIEANLLSQGPSTITDRC